MDDTDEYTCSVCQAGGLAEEDTEYSEIHGRMCLSCVRKEWPEHISIGCDGLDDSDVVLKGHLGGWLAIHTPTGIAAFVDKHPTLTGNRRAVMRLLRKIYADVSQIESNERYGSLME